MAFIAREDMTRIAGAISAAESKTSGEIVAVVAPQSSSYLYVPFLWAAVVALTVPWPLIKLTWWPSTWIYLAQLATFLILVATLMPRPMRLMLVPHSVRRSLARRRAREQFLVQNLHTTEGRTGVLLFVSVAERHVEIIADAAIDARVAAGTWQGIVDQLTEAIGAGRAAEGFIEAVEAIGQHLARHFPPGLVDADELPNHLIVLADEF